jgi:hypothetical protein
MALVGSPGPRYKVCREGLVRIFLGEWRMGEELGEFFRRSECSVEPVGEHVLEVNPRLPLLPDAARLEIEGLLRVWCRLHPEAPATVSPPEPATLKQVRRGPSVDATAG